MATAQSAHKVTIFVLWYNLVRSRMEGFVMATAQAAHKVIFNFILWYCVVGSRMEGYVMDTAQSAYKVFDFFGLATCRVQCAFKTNFLKFETTLLINYIIPDSKYQGYLGPQGALDSPSGSHRAHWKFRKVIFQFIEVEVCILNMIHVPGPCCCQLYKSIFHH